MNNQEDLVLRFADIGAADTASVGGKAASLGEMYRELQSRGVPVPDGFATTTAAWSAFIREPLTPRARVELLRAEGGDRLAPVLPPVCTLEEALRICFDDLDPADEVDLHERCDMARVLVCHTPVPETVRSAILTSYWTLCGSDADKLDVAVRSSATCEDSGDASFAGQFESYLNVRGGEDVLRHWQLCGASLFGERVISYQLDMGIDPLTTGLAVVVMRMVRSDLGLSGVIFTLDPESGHRGVVHVSSSYGLGEMIVQGAATPDTYVLWKRALESGDAAVIRRRLGAKETRLVYDTAGRGRTREETVPERERAALTLTDEQAEQLGRMALAIEKHYGRPMDIEWAQDGRTGELFIVQARPETVHANRSGRSFEVYRMDGALVTRLRDEDRLLVTGTAVGCRIGAGTVRRYGCWEDVLDQRRRYDELLASGVGEDEIDPADRVFDDGDVLVTGMTAPDWEPLMKRASLIVTERGGRTSHAAIIAREFGIPAVVGCGDATSVLATGMEVTGSCAEGDLGAVYAGIQPFDVEEVPLEDGLELRTRIKLNVGLPERALADSLLPSDGVGLARLEFILSAEVGIHPLALQHLDALKHYADTGELDETLRPFAATIEAEEAESLREMLREVEQATVGYGDKTRFFVDRLREGVAMVCAAFHPRPVIIRLSDFKSNEYRQLVAGRLFEPQEENPMIAWRGASRYVDPRFAPAFGLECRALREVFVEQGLDNLQVMVPFCRTPGEGRAVKDLLERQGLCEDRGVRLHLMVELPSNVLEAERFIDLMELSGGSIGTNDLVQTTYAVSRDDLENYPFAVDARSPAVQELVRRAIQSFRARDLEIGICGQAPSDHPDEVPPFLVACGISSISVTSDTLLQVRRAVARAEAGGGRAAGALRINDKYGEMASVRDRRRDDRAG